MQETDFAMLEAMVPFVAKFVMSYAVALEKRGFVDSVGPMCQGLSALVWARLLGVEVVTLPLGPMPE